MMFRFTLIIALALVSACGTLAKKKTDASLKTISFHGNVHKPYCGGAKPNPDIASGYYESMKFEKFKIVQGKSFSEGMTVFKEISLDVEGNATFQLPVGDYMMIRSEKYLPLDEFIKKNGPLEEQNFKVKGTDCFKEWKNTPEMYFKVESDTSIELRMKAKCWVGINECLEYVGPPAP